MSEYNKDDSNGKLESLGSSLERAIKVFDDLLRLLNEKIDYITKLEEEVKLKPSSSHLEALEAEISELKKINELARESKPESVTSEQSKRLRDLGENVSEIQAAYDALKRTKERELGEKDDEIERLKELLEEKDDENDDYGGFLKDYETQPGAGGRLLTEGVLLGYESMLSGRESSWCRILAAGCTGILFGCLLIINVCPPC